MKYRLTKLGYLFIGSILIAMLISPILFGIVFGVWVWGSVICNIHKYGCNDDDDL